MKIDGRAIASRIQDQLIKQGEKLKSRHITPHLAVILVGNDPASHAYVSQKQKRGDAIGVLVTVHMYAEDATTDQLLREILMLNRDPLTHGIIVQQPLPEGIDSEELVNNTDPKKDVDGFHKRSKFTPPIADAAIHVLEEIFSKLPEPPDNFLSWLKNQSIVVIGKGETGGGPIIAKLKKMGITPVVIDSKTADPKSVMQNTDIIISCVGRPGIVKKNMLKKGAILIGIGMFRGSDGKLHADYEEDDIKDIAGYYTSVPGGIGPVNVTMLLKNVIDAAGK